MKNQLLEQISRMKVLGGMVNEAAGLSNPVSIFSKVIAKITKTALDDTILKAFEVLEKKDVFVIDKITNKITLIDWAKLTDDELKLLFRAKPMRDILEEVTKSAGVDITSAATKATLTGGFRKIVKAYDDAAGSIISSAGSKTTSNAASSWKNRLSNILGGTKSAKGVGRYAPTPEDFLDVENLVIAANPGISGRKVSQITNEARRIVSAKSQEEFMELADSIIISMSGKLNKPKEWIGKRLFRLVQSNPKTAILCAVVFAPTISAGVAVGVSDQINTFVRELSPKLSSMLDKVGFSDPRTNTPNTTNNTPVKNNNSNPLNISPSKDSIPAQPSGDNDPLGILPKSGGGN